MKPFFDECGSTIYHGDCVEVVKHFEPDRFDTVITDPPYHLISNKRGGSGVTTGFMGKTWDGGDVAFRPETWTEVLRVCKPGAMLLAFGGTRTFHRLACAIEDAGWEIRDCFSWLYGSGFPKSLNISKAIDKAAGAERAVISEGAPVKRMIPGADQNATGSWIKDNGREFVPTITEPATEAAALWNGWGTALKPAWEPIVVAMKPLDGTFAENALKHGIAGLNIDAARIETADDLNGGAYSEVGGRRVSQSLHGDTGMNVAGKTTGRAYVQPAGRWPANVILDEEAAEILDQQAGVLSSGANPTRRSSDKFRQTYSPFAGEEQCVVHRGANTGGASRFFYTAKASQSERGRFNDHPTVKPVDLLKYLCLLTATPTGGQILDPFGGSMTTLVAAREAGRPAVAIDIEESHCRIGAKRLAQAVLFGGHAS